jgi:hypothetical protein
MRQEVVIDTCCGEIKEGVWYMPLWDGDILALECEDCYKKTEGHDPHAQLMGSKGGKIGGSARARSLSPERRTEISRNAALQRWDKARSKRGMR